MRPTFRIISQFLPNKFGFSRPKKIIFILIVSVVFHIVGVWIFAPKVGARFARMVQKEKMDGF